MLLVASTSIFDMVSKFDTVLWEINMDYYRFFPAVSLPFSYFSIIIIKPSTFRAHNDPSRSLLAHYVWANISEAW